MTRSLRTIMTALAALLLALAIAACGEDGGNQQAADQGGVEQDEPAAQEIERNPNNSSKTVTVGSKNFPEQFVLGEIYSQALEAAGFKVKKELNLGSEVVAYKALRQGDVDAYPEYTGTALTAFFKVKTDKVPSEAQAAYQDAKQRLAKQNITALPPTPFENTYRLGMLKEKAQQLGNPTKISDLQGKAQNLTITGYPECRQRRDCLLGVQDTYGLKFKDFVASEQTYEVLDQKEADVGFVFTTDAQLATDKYQVLDDDKNFFPPYNISFLMRDEALQKIGNEGQQVVERVQKPLTDEVMRELNSRVVLDKQKPQQVARDYLKAEGFVK